MKGLEKIIDVLILSDNLIYARRTDFNCVQNSMPFHGDVNCGDQQKSF